VVPITTTRQPFYYVTKDGRAVPRRELDAYVLKESGAEASQQIRQEDRFTNAYGDMGLVRPLYHPERLAYAPEVNAYHARCCQVKSRDSTGLGWDIVALTTNPPEGVKEDIERFFETQRTPLVSILSRYQYDIEVIGWGAIEVVRVGYAPDGLPSLLAHVPAHTLRIHKDDNKYAQKRGARTRWFKRIGYEKDIDKDNGGEHELGSLPAERRASELIWSALYSQRSDYYGVPDIVPALGAVHGEIARRDYNIAFFDNFGVPAYAVFITGDFDPGLPDEETGKTPLEAGIEEHFKQLSTNPHSVMILSVPSREGGTADVQIKFQPLATDVKDASFRLYRKDNRDEIISAHGVPPYRLGIAETGSLGGGTAEESTEIYKNSVIRPRQELLESLINQHIIQSEAGFATDQWAFKFREIDTKDEKHDIEVISKMFLMGAATPRDIIQAFGDRFGIEADEADPVLDMRFVNNQPITEMVSPSGQHIEDVVKSLQEKLLQAAVKHVGISDVDGDGPDNRAALALVDSVKNLGGLDSGR